MDVSTDFTKQKLSLLPNCLWFFIFWCFCLPIFWILYNDISHSYIDKFEPIDYYCLIIKLWWESIQWPEKLTKQTKHNVVIISRLRLKLILSYNKFFFLFFFGYASTFFIIWRKHLVKIFKKSSSKIVCRFGWIRDSGKKDANTSIWAETMAFFQWQMSDCVGKNLLFFSDQRKESRKGWVTDSNESQNDWQHQHLRCRIEYVRGWCCAFCVCNFSAHNTMSDSLFLHFHSVSLLIWLIWLSLMWYLS